MAIAPDRLDTANSPSAEPATWPTLTIDYALYEAYLVEADLTEAQKKELLDALWSIIVSFVDLGFAVAPAAKSCGEMPQAAAQFMTSVVDSPSDPDHQGEAP